MNAYQLILTAIIAAYTIKYGIGATLVAAAFFAVLLAVWVGFTALCEWLDA